MYSVNQQHIDHHHNRAGHVLSLTASQGIAVAPAVTNRRHSQTLYSSTPTQDLHQMQQQDDAARKNILQGRIHADLEQPPLESLWPHSEASVHYHHPIAMSSPYSQQTACPSVATTETGRSSVPSSVYGTISDSGETGMAMSSSEHEPPKQKKYMCPICNMGYGHYIRPYSKGGNEAPRSTETLSSSARVPVYLHHWDRPSCFADHIKSHHMRLYTRVWPDNGYVCRLCPCDSLDITVGCGSTFTREGDIVNHLATRHINNPEDLSMYDHLCGPAASGPNAKA